MNQQTIEDFIQEYQEFQNAFQKKAQEKLKDVFKHFWDENPGINVVIWTQYAPYFNDGDACVFRINDLTFSNAVEEDDINDLDWGEYEGETEGVWACGNWKIDEISKNHAGVNEESVKLLCKFIHSNPMENVLEMTFGSDNRIVATREGFTSEDYSNRHD